MTRSAENTSQGWFYVGRAALLVTVLTGLLMAVGGVFHESRLSTARVAANVVHVNFSYVLWPMLLLADWWSRQLSGFERRLSSLGLVLAVCGALVIVFVPWAGNGPPLSSPLPLVRHPLHGAALILFVTGIWLALLAWLVNHRRRTAGQVDVLLWYPALLFVLAFVASGWTWFAAGNAEWEVRLSNALWVALAELSFLQASLLLRGWFWLLDRDGQCDLLSSRWRHTLLLVTVLPAVLVLPLLALVDTEDPAFLSNFDLLVSWGAWPMVAMAGLLLAARWGRRWSSSAKPIARYTFVASLFLCLLGALAGVVAEESGMLYRAQLHWSGGSLVLVFVGLLGGTPLQGRMFPNARPVERVSHLEPWVWFMGMLVVGGGASLLGVLFGVGAPQEVGGHGSLAPLGRWLLALGGLLTLLGALLTARRLTGARRARSLGGCLDGMRDRLMGMDLRVRAMLATALAIGMIGGIIALLPPQIGMSTPERVTGLPSENHEHVVGQMRGEVKERFDQGVVMLHAKRYDEAATAFHRVLALAPEMPEAHVNMGFAMLGKGDYKLALDFFEGATELRVNQLNAYYGMALAYEGLGNIEAAAGAMKSYQHLTAPDDPFLPKVNAKLQQYEQQRGARPPAAGA